ncbi:hypothetical protein MUK42_04387 [Musa troglodytarum]|uniref:Uncharacterized protein n=1 Tax=Musa troglodytarum TaxID=320322 RepID=A0A9E7H639_9LILI|nr:hypothetical protein MUK42_04387 [Musa troglodytarum]
MSIQFPMSPAARAYRNKHHRMPTPMSPGDNIPTDGVAVFSDVVVNSIIELVEVKLGSLLGLVVDRHVRGTPRAPRVHRRDEHVEEADRAPGDRHCRGQRLGVAAVAVLAPVGRHGGGGGYRLGGRRRGAVGEAASRGPLFAAGALEGGLHLLEGAHAAVTQGCRRRPLLQKVGGGGSRGEREVEVVAMASHRIMVALLEGVISWSCKKCPRKRESFGQLKVRTSS